MRNCNFGDTIHEDGVYTCQRCGLTTKYTPHPPDRIFATCRVQSGLGTAIGHVLAGVGITKQRYLWAKSKITGKPAKCGCEKRADTLDRWSDKVARKIKKLVG